MRVGRRLFLAFLPALLGCALVAGLAYWGQYGQVVPPLLLALAAVAALASLVVSWVSTRYVAQRLERLAGPAAPPANESGAGVARRIASALGAHSRARPADELDVLETVVDGLSGAVSAAEQERERASGEANARLREYAELLSAATGRMSAQLEEVRLPLHVLLESQFGELNENQEELIAAARQAADLADEELRRLRAVADIDRGAVERRRESLRLADLLPPLVAAAQARAERRRVSVALSVAPALPRVTGDLVRMQEALALVLDDAIARAAPEATIAATAETEGGGVVVRVTHSPEPVAPAGSKRSVGGELALARRLVELQGGALREGDGVTLVRFPVARGTG